MLKKYVAGIAALAVAIALTVTADAGNGKKHQGKKTQAQMSSCSKCNKVQQKDCNKPNCDKKKAGEPCPSDCPKRK